MISDRLLRKINAYHIQEVEPRLPCNQESSPRQRARTLASSTVKRKSRDGKKETLFRRTSSLDKVKDLVENVSTDSKGGQHQLQDDGEDFPDEFHFFEKHVLPLSSQSNIYSVFLFGKTEDGTDRIFVASQTGHVNVFQTKFANPSSSDYRLLAGSVALSFNHISPDFRIVAVSGWDNGDFDKGVIFAMLPRSGEETSSCKPFMSVYLTDKNLESSFDSANQADGDIKSLCDSSNCFQISLSFIPLQLEHCLIPKLGDEDKWYHFENLEHAFLASGDDCFVHLMLLENSSHPKENEASTRDAVFPEFAKAFECIVTKFTIIYCQKRKIRLTAVGLQNGRIHLFAVDLDNDVEGEKKIKVMNSLSIRHDSTVTDLQFFKWRQDADAEMDSLNFLVLSALEPAVIYSKIIGNLIQSQPLDLSRTILDESSQYDCVHTAVIDDLLLTGEKQIYIGTFGQAVLVYDNSSSSTRSPHYIRPKMIIETAHPIQKLMSADISGDGLRSLCVLSNKALQIFALRETVLIRRLAGV